MGGSPSKTVYQSFDEVRGTFYADLEKTNAAFEQRVFNLVMSKGQFDASNIETQKKVLDTSGKVKLDEKDLPDPKQNNQAEVKTKDENGNETDPAKATSSNQYIAIYDKKYMSVTYSGNKDFKGVKQAVDEYGKELNNLFTAGAGAGAAAASGNPLSVVKTLFSNSDSIMGSITGIVKTTLNLVSVQSAVGITEYVESTFIPGGIYVCNLVYTANSQVQTSSKTESAAMSICHTIVCTSTDLINAMRNQQLISQQMVLMSNFSLDVMQKQGEILGWGEAYPSFLKLTLTTKKSKFNEVSNYMKSHLAGLPWKADQGPTAAGKDLTELAVYQSSLNDFKNYGFYRGYTSAIELVDTIIEAALDSTDMSEFKDSLKDCKEALAELKSSTLEDYNTFYKTYQDAIEKLRSMIGH